MSQALEELATLREASGLIKIKKKCHHKLT